MSLLSLHACGFALGFRLDLGTIVRASLFGLQAVVAGGSIVSAVGENTVLERDVLSEKLSAIFLMRLEPSKTRTEGLSLRSREYVGEEPGSI
jgi:hypothetical protein